jgi:hypothetical protein
MSAENPQTKDKKRRNDFWKMLWGKRSPLAEESHQLEALHYASRSIQAGEKCERVFELGGDGEALCPSAVRG